MERQIEELTLLLVYLTSWEENVGTKKKQIKVLHSWKGYPFEVINTLVEKDDLRGSFHAKSVMLTEQGVKRAERLKKKYLR
jgi:hypothetical protein